MRVITELELREQYKKSEFTSFYLPEGARLTPAAAQFLSERRIPVLAGEGQQRQEAEANASAAGQVFKLEEGARKPEHLTHLKGSTLVAKNHPRIKFRGKLDSYEGLLIAAIIEVEGLGYRDLGQDLREVLNYVRKILAAEVKEEALEELTFHAWSEAEIHERSHHPHKYFGLGHLLPSPEQGRLMAQLNMLRAGVREVELVAMDTFYTSPTEVERADILQALNRLSSLIYVMMLQLAAGHYKLGN